MPARRRAVSRGFGRQGSAWSTAARDLLLVSLDGVVRLHGRTAETVVVPGLAATVPAGERFRTQAHHGARIWWLWAAPPDTTASGLGSFFESPILSAAARSPSAWSTSGSVSQHLASALRGLVPKWIAATPPVLLPRPADPRLRTALDWLSERLERPVGLPDAARTAGLAERTFQRRCRSDLGLSLTAWLTRARMLRAIAHLADSDMPIAGVVLRCGYQSPAAFTRAFTSLIGTTPSAWRTQDRTI